jgi:DinB superfamily
MNRLKVPIRASIVSVVLFAATASLHAQSNPLSADAKSDYTSIKTILLKSADKMPEENYGFRTTPLVRTYAEMIAHIADVQTMLCSTAMGQPKHGTAAGKTSKADLSAALKESFDTCDPVYDQMTDAQGTQTVKMFGHDKTKIGVLFFNVEHDNEMYGQMVAYMRIKGIVPPSSEARP